ncbi:hypothetical protein QN277_028778 [Acacia crassicarpa]|uniref:WAT1-related protein n=1 Tax=Acacia crassicarpa TaxID=499986 RepID=A0AAE1J422_9FABA|nr:hypothetical protein QN277_028778 [Acacia crassicarpa]
MAWCVSKGGPVFVSVFIPLQLLFLAFVGSFFLNETLHLGSIIGGVLIVGGLYMVLWGKGKEMKKKDLLAASQTLHVSSSPSVDIIVESSNVVNRDHQGSSENENQAISDGKNQVASRNISDI